MRLVHALHHAHINNPNRKETIPTKASKVVRRALFKLGIQDETSLETKDKETLENTVKMLVRTQNGDTIDSRSMLRYAEQYIQAISNITYRENTP